MRKTYPVPFFMPAMFALAVLGYGLVVLIFLLVIVTGSAYEPRDLLVLAFLTPLMAIIAWIWTGSWGEVILEEDCVIVRRRGRERSLRYAEILSVRERDFNLPPRLILIGRNGRLSISRRAENFEELYRTLRMRIPTIINRELAVTGADQAHNGSPWCLRWTRGFIVTNSICAVVIAIFLVGTFVLIVTQEPTMTAFLAGGAILFFMVLLIIVAFIYTEIQPDQPIEYIFRKEEIRFRYPFGDWSWISASDLIRIDLRHEKVQGVTRYRVVLVHSHGQEMVMDLRRSRQFGCEPEQIYEMLKRVYR
jgi:hypothetical protein